MGKSTQKCAGHEETRSQLRHRPRVQHPDKGEFNVEDCSCSRTRVGNRRTDAHPDLYQRRRLLVRTAQLLSPPSTPSLSLPFAHRPHSLLGRRVDSAPPPLDGSAIRRKSFGQSFESPRLPRLRNAGVSCAAASCAPLDEISGVLDSLPLLHALIASSNPITASTEAIARMGKVSQMLPSAATVSSTCIGSAARRDPIHNGRATSTAARSDRPSATTRRCRR
jgi:hypothetical protein